ncbi:MAG: dTMP kinase [Chloroflexi bacterium]|nr:MAG: dTMP kinase [Chloroflexota bacterium]
MFITLEGGEGAGKSTQAALLYDRLLIGGYRARLTREPGGTPLASAIRSLVLHPEASLHALAASNLTGEAETEHEPMLPMTELLLYSGARAQHVVRLREWLAAGEIIVCDRYADATRVYQGVARGIDATTIATLEHLVTGGLLPDITFLFDVPVDEGQRRRRRGKKTGAQWDRLDAETSAFHELVRQGYLDIAAAEPERWIVLDATLSPDDLEQQIWGLVKDRLPPQTMSSS